MKTAPHLGRVAGAVFAVVDRTSCGEVQFKVGRIVNSCSASSST